METFNWQEKKEPLLLGKSWHENIKPGPLSGMLGTFQYEITTVVTVANQSSIYVLR